MPTSLFCKWGKNTSLLAGGISILLLIISCLWVAPEIGAKEYPAKPITIIVPWPPGPSTDLTPRILAPKLSQRWGVPVSVVNKPGGAGTIGALEVVKSAPDGYTIMSDCPGTSSIQSAWSENLRLGARDFQMCSWPRLEPLSSPRASICRKPGRSRTGAQERL